MKRNVFLLLALLVVACAADNPVQTGQQPVNDPGYVVHSLGIKILQAPAPSRIGGMWLMPGGVKKAFFYSGVIDGKSPLKDPIFNEALPIQCIDESCRNFRFTLIAPENKAQRVVVAHVFKVTSTNAQVESTIDGDAHQDYRILWQQLLKKGVDLDTSSFVRASLPESTFLSATLVSKEAPAFHVYFPSEAEGKLSVEYQTHDGSFFGGAHAVGELTTIEKLARVRLPGGLVDLTLED